MKASSGDISERLRLLVEDFAGGNYSKFARLVGSTRSTFQNYVTGAAVPSVLTISKICEACGVSADWLIFGVEHAERGPHANNAAVPLLKRAAFSDAAQALVRPVNTSGAVVVDGEPDKLAAFVVEDTGLSPSVEPGDVVIFDYSLTEPGDVQNALAVIAHAGLAVVRHVVDRLAVSNRPVDFPPLDVTKCRIAGAVVEIRRKIRGL